MKIIADSSCLCSSNNDITTIPVGVIIDGKVYKDYIEIQSHELLDILNKGIIPTTSQPSIGDILEAFENTNEDILMLTIGDGLSGTYQSANAARTMTNKQEKIHIIDTKTLAGAYHYLVEKAIQLNKEEKEINQIILELKDSIEHSYSYVIPSDFQFLKRCGRLTSIAAQVGGLLKIVPVLTLTEDRKKIEILSIKRTNKKALESIIQSLLNKGVNDSYRISVCHVNDIDKAKETINYLKNTFKNASYEILELSPSLMLHGGPGCILIHATKL